MSLVLSFTLKVSLANVNLHTKCYAEADIEFWLSKSENQSEREIQCL